MSIRPLVLCTVLAIVGLPVATHPACAQAQPEARTSAKINLRPKFAKGQEIRFKMVIDSASTDAQGAEKDTQSTNQEIGLLLRCSSVDPESGAKLDLVYESLKMNVKSAVLNVQFDSAKPAKADDPTDAALRSIVGLTLPVTIDKDGNISAVGSAEGGLGAAGALVGQFSGGDMIKSMFGPIFTTKKGAGEAAVGESWTNEDVIEAPAGTIRLSLTHTLDSVSGGKAVIPMKGRATLSPSAAGGAAAKAAIRDSSISGKTIWDIEAGMLQSMETRQRLTVETTSSGQASTHTQEMNVRVTRTSKDR